MKLSSKIKFVLAGLVIFTSLIASANYQIEPLLGNGFNQNGVFIQVYTGGCTDKDSFQVEVENRDSLKILSFYRIRPDFCRAFYRYGKKNIV